MSTRILEQAQTWSAMIKLAHSVFALPFALFAAVVASGGLPRWDHALLIVVCMVAARSAAMTFNRLADQRIDAVNPRTASRPLPAGLISRPTAWGFFAGSIILFLVGCLGFWWLDRNPWPIVLAVPVLGVLCGYSYTKRFTHWSHVVLGLAIAFSPVAAWIAISPQTLGAAAWLLMLAVTFWIAGFDIIYACQDHEFDKQTGLHSVPASFGIAGALWLARGFHGITVAALIAVGFSSGLGMLYGIGTAAVVILLLVEHSLVSPKDLSKVNLAFFTMNGLVSLVYGVLGIADVLWRVGI